MKMYGDPALLDGFPELSEDVYMWWSGIKAAYVWDYYGLPDGTVNPGIQGFAGTFKEYDDGSGEMMLTIAPPGRTIPENERTPQVGHVLMEPPDEYLDYSFSKVLWPVLCEEDRWLLRLPKRYGNLGVLDARIVVSRQGGVAILMPRGMLGGLFLCNEFLCSLPENWRTEDIASVAHILEHWLVRPTKSEEWDFDAIDRELQWRRVALSDDARKEVWSTTTSQQLFLILHELGHVRDLNAQGEEQKSKIERETSADRFALGCMKLLGSQIFDGDLRDIFKSVLLLFGIFKVLNMEAKLQMDQPEWQERFAQIAHCWAAASGASLTPDEVAKFADRAEYLVLGTGREAM